MDTILVCYIFIINLYSAFILYKYFLFFKKVNKNNSNNLNKNKGLFIAIPCLREQNVIEDTIKYFRSICNLPIVIITTQKENYECRYNKDYVTTKMVVEKNILNKYNNVFLVDYPSTTGYMADQLNYMLKNIKKLDFYDNKKEWYMSLYNADSKPSKDSFKSIFYKINKNEKVIQQYSYCFKNLDKLSYITKGFAIYQSNFEIKVGLFNSSLKYKYLYNYVVGHGLTIDLKTLDEMGNFNTTFWCEDIYLTMKLKYNNIKITPIPELENIENATSLKQIAKQNSVWYDTTKKYRKVYKDIKTQSKKGSFTGIIGYFNEFRCAVNWLLFPIILFATIIIGLYNKKVLLESIIILSYLFYSFINYYITIKTINKLNKKNYSLSILNYISYTIALLISNIGPIYSIFFKNKEKYKTER